MPIVRQAHMATAVQQDTFVPLFQLREGPAAEVGVGGVWEAGVMKVRVGASPPIRCALAWYCFDIEIS